MSSLPVAAPPSAVDDSISSAPSPAPTTSSAPIAAPATEAFPAFNEETTEGSPSTTPSPSPVPPRRRRSRNVTHLDRSLFLGLPPGKAFDYVDLVRSLRAPPFEPPKVQSSSPSTSTTTITAAAATSREIVIDEVPEWPPSESQSPAQLASSGLLAQTSGSMQQETANTSQNTT